MTIKELYKGLKLIAPTAFDHFVKPQTLPYIVYIVPNTTPMAADNTNLINVLTVQIELYTQVKDSALETSLESFLSFTPFTKSEGYLTDSEMYMVTYQISMKGN